MAIENQGYSRIGSRFLHVPDEHGIDIIILIEIDSKQITSGILTRFASDSPVNLNNDFDYLAGSLDNQNHCSSSLTNHWQIVSEFRYRF